MGMRQRTGIGIPRGEKRWIGCPLTIWFQKLLIDKSVFALILSILLRTQCHYVFHACSELVGVLVQNGVVGECGGLGFLSSGNLYNILSCHFSPVYTVCINHRRATMYIHSNTPINKQDRWSIKNKLQAFNNLTLRLYGHRKCPHHNQLPVRRSSDVLRRWYCRQANYPRWLFFLI